jgi:hypothetical protein
MKKRYCDECECEIDAIHHMVDGQLRLDGFHSAGAHVMNIQVIFVKDVSINCDNPDLCRNCAKKHLIAAFSK